MFAELIVGASSSLTCSLLLEQQEARALLASIVSSAVPHSYLVTIWCYLKQKIIYLSLSTMNGGVRISTTTQYKSVYVILEQLVMLAFPLSVFNVSRAWVKYKNELSCSSLAVAFHKGGAGQRFQGEGGRRDSHKLTWTHRHPDLKTRCWRTTHREGVWCHALLQMKLCH